MPSRMASSSIALLALAWTACSNQGRPPVAVPSQVPSTLTAASNPDAPETNCVRHIYNQGLCAWFVQSEPVPGVGRLGNVWFLDYTCASADTAVDRNRDLAAAGRPVRRPSAGEPPRGDGRVPAKCTNPNGPCIIDPGCWVTVEFTTEDRYSEGKWFLWPAGRDGQSFVYRGGGFDPSSCPYIYHDGPTGGVYLNHPVDGDITIAECSF